MRAFLGVVVGLLVALPAQAAEVPAEYEALKTQAEQFYAQRSYSLAHQFYLKADAWDLPSAEARWVDFRLADTLWRSQAGTQTADSTVYDKARQQLEVRDVQLLRLNRLRLALGRLERHGAVAHRRLELLAQPFFGIGEGQVH